MQPGTSGAGTDIKIARPFPIYAVPRVWQWTEEFPHLIRTDNTPKNLAEFVADWERQDAAGRITWVVSRDGELGGVGMLTVLAPYLAGAQFIFKKAFWGGKTCIPAMRMILADAFASTPAEKITVLALRNNHALVSLVMQCGGRKEGIFEGQAARDGKPLDVIALAVKRSVYAEPQQPTRGTDRAGEPLRIREQQHQHEQLGELHPERQRDEHEQLEPDAVPVVAASSAIPVCGAALQ